MRVTLKPVSHPEMGEINIAGDLFAIGRNEEPFVSSLGTAAARLSRRHARIFEENGKVYVADLGSLNGTQVNKQPLKQAAALRNDDLVSFGDEISFRVEIKPEHAKTVMRTPPVRLTLVPADPNSGLEAIVIERFPFLVARVESAFEQYKDEFPEALRQLSRRHAVVALKGDKVFVEDLESSNGTFVGGERLDERARQLADGDTVMFGSPQFTFKVRVQSQIEPTRAFETEFGRLEGTVAAVPASPSDPSVDVPADAEPSKGNRTRFVSSADSFINVFCAEEREGQAAQKGKDVAETAKVAALEQPTRPLQKLKAAINEYWRALRGDKAIDRRVPRFATGVFIIAVAAVAASYFIGSGRREIKSLLDDGEYVQSAQAASNYLARHPDDREASGWAEQALIKAVVPAWIAYIDQSRFEDATQYLRSARESYKSIPRSAQIIESLAWAGRVQAHMADRGGPSGKVILFRHEEPIKTLVADWDRDAFRRQQIMDQIVTQVPEFEHVHSQVFSSLRTLRSDNELYVKASEQLQSNVTAALKKNDRRGVDKLISDFATDYSHVGGLDVLNEDLARYDELTRLFEQKNLLELVRVSRATKFRTPVLAGYVDGWLAASLPPQDIIAKHAEAAAAWRAGNHDDAIAILEPLAAEAKPGSWGDVAALQIARYRKVQADYEDLVVSRDSDNYWNKLLLVWSSLRPNEDEFIIRTLEPDFLAHREQVVPLLDQSLLRARDYWNNYENAGGIPGVVRVEDRVSERFSSQAKRLSSAYDEVVATSRTYRLLQVTPSAEWQSLQEQVVNEVERQRRWLQDLNIVLEPALLRAKLAMLPPAQEQSLWVRSTTDPNKD
jgi:pSer/pThr/pTyr-binding forkhead associated (FHA) protein